jgi:hypothetical protein
MPWADAMYGCDERWWRAHDGCKRFMGRKWSSHSRTESEGVDNDKRAVAREYHVHLVTGEGGNKFSTRQDLIRYGGNSLFQAINLAILHGSPYIVLVGADLRHVGGKSHFFGDHPEGLYRNPNFTRFDKNFVEAAGDLPEGVEIVNATPGTAMTAFPVMELEEAIGRFGKDGSVHRDRPVPVADTN